MADHIILYAKNILIICNVCVAGLTQNVEPEIVA